MSALRKIVRKGERIEMFELTKEQQERIDKANEEFHIWHNRPYTYVVEVSLLTLLPRLPAKILCFEYDELRPVLVERIIEKSIIHRTKKRFKGAESVMFFLDSAKSTTDFWKIERNTRHDLDNTYIWITSQEADRLQVTRKFQKEDFIEFPGSRLAIANTDRIKTLDDRPAVRNSAQTIIYID